MSITPVGSNPSPNIGSLLLQQLAAAAASSQGPGGAAGLLGDQLTLSPEAQKLAQALGAGTQGTSADSKSILLTALMNAQSNASNPASLLSLLQNPGQDSLFATLGSSGGGFEDRSDSILG